MNVSQLNGIQYKQSAHKRDMNKYKRVRRKGGRGIDRPYCAGITEKKVIPPPRATPNKLTGRILESDRIATRRFMLTPISFTFFGIKSTAQCDANLELCRATRWNLVKGHVGVSFEHERRFGT